MSHPLELFRFCPVCGSNKFIENNNQSKRCETCGFIDYINPKAAVVAVITNTKGDILVCRRAKDPAKGTLDMPGGFTDLNESRYTGGQRRNRTYRNGNPISVFFA